MALFHSNKITFVLILCTGLLVLIGGMLLFRVQMLKPITNQMEQNGHVRTDEINTAYRAAVREIVEQLLTTDEKTLVRILPELAERCKQLTLTSAYKDFHIGLYLLLQRNADTAPVSEPATVTAAVHTDVATLEKKFPEVFRSLSSLPETRTK